MTSKSCFTILVGTDFSAPAGRAVDQALELGTLHDGSDVHVVHVAPDPSPFEGGLGDAIDAEAALEQVQRVAEAHIASMAPTLDGTRIRRVVTHLRRGSPARAVAQLGADLDVDLIIVGSHGRRGLDRFLMGSVAERVAHLARCPVWIVRPKDHSTVDRVPEIEPTCPNCLEARRQTGDAALWCARHSEHHLRAHGYSYTSDGMYSSRTTSYASTPGQ